MSGEARAAAHLVVIKDCIPVICVEAVEGVIQAEEVADCLGRRLSDRVGFDGLGVLRCFYPLGTNEIHYDATPALEKAYAWVQGLHVRAIVGTESRLQTAIGASLGQLTAGETAVYGDLVSARFGENVRLA